MPEHSARPSKNQWRLIALAAALSTGCPQLLQDGFGTAAPDVPLGEDGGSENTPSGRDAGLIGAALPDASQSSSGGATGNPEAGSSGTAGVGGSEASGGGSGESSGGAGGNSGTGGSDDAGQPPPPPPPEDSGVSAPDSSPCVAATEICDGLDNDCDGQIDQGTTCPTGCQGLQILGRSYMYCGGSGASDATAETRCTGQGMHLVVIETADENAAILAAVAPVHAQLSTVTEDQASIWTGAQDIAVEGTWRWGAGGPEFWTANAPTGVAYNGAYANWATGKPNDAPPGEDCAVLYVGTGTNGDLGQWNDLVCSTGHAFLCEQSP